MEEKKVIKEIKTPIKYLVKKLNKIDSSLTVKPLTDNPDYIVFNGKISEQEEVLYYFNQRQYSSYGLMRFIEDHNTDDFIEINKAINVWLNSKEKNGSTMPFEDDISNDSQKKSVLSGLYTKKEVEETIAHVLKGQSKMKNKEQIKRDLIDYLLDDGISYSVYNSPSSIDQIEIKNETGSKICFIDFNNNNTIRVVLQRVGQVDEEHLEQLVGLYGQMLKMIDGLKHVKEHEDDW